jgi:hypothetical protein
MPEFRPGEYSAKLAVENKALFLTGDRTWGGTSDLLAKAVDRAGFRGWFAYTYGDGFAFVLPMEEIQANGRPAGAKDRFRYEPNLNGRDFRRIFDIVRDAKEPSTHAYRVLVLVAGEAPRDSGALGKSANLWRPAGNMGLPDYARYRKWAADPKLTVLVYEFRPRRGKGAPALRKRGEPGIPAREHVVASGLWTARDLR